MKIRTDFVTNSSSSNFMVTVTVMSKSGKSYKFSRGSDEYSDIEYDSTDFHGNLYGLMKDSSARDAIDNCLRELMDIESSHYEKVLLKDTDKAASDIEKISVGDEVVLKPRQSDWDCNVDVYHNGNRIGEFPSGKGYSLGKWIVKYVLGKKKIGAYEAKVVGVKPLSKQKSPTSPKVHVSVNLLLNDVSIPERTLDFESVEALCKYLSRSVYDGWGDEPKGKIDSRFVKSASSGIQRVSDVSKIIVEREWNAWGEGADLFADNDEQLCELAQKVVSYANSVEKKKEALAAMRKYIESDEYSDLMGGESGFGDGCSFHYVYDGDDEDLEKLARRLCSNRGPNTTSGVEHYELNTLTGEVTADAYFDLN